MLSVKRLPSQWRFSDKQGTNKGRDNKAKCEMAKVKQQAFSFRIARVHSSLERRVKYLSLIGQKSVDCILDWNVFNTKRKPRRKDSSINVRSRKCVF